MSLSSCAAKCPYCEGWFQKKKDEPWFCSNCTCFNEREKKEIPRLFDVFKDKALDEKVEKLLMENRDKEAIDLIRELDPSRRERFRKTWKKYRSKKDVAKE